MSILDDKEKTKREIFALCTDYNNYEKFIKEFSDDTNKTYEGIGYLIEKDLIKNYEKSIFYKDLKPIICNGFQICEKSIESKCKCENFQMSYVSQKKFKEKGELKVRLKVNEFKLITLELWKKISPTINRNEEGIKFKIANKIISLIFNENKTLDFKIDNFLISESTLIEDEKDLINNKEKSENNEDVIGICDSVKNINTNKNEKKINSDNNTEETPIKEDTKQNGGSKTDKLDEQNIDETKNNLILNVKKAIKIIILIQRFQKKLKNEINDEKILKKKGFIISQKWLEKFKSIFFYDKIKVYLDKNIAQEKDEKKQIEIENVYNFLKDEINLDKIQQEVQNLIGLEEIKPKELNIENEHNITYPEIFYIIDENILNNFKQINIFEKIFNSLELKPYFINNGKIILKYDSIPIKENNTNNNKIIICHLNENYLCVPELLLNYTKANNISDNFFEHIFKIPNKKYNLEMQEKDIMENGNKIGSVYKLIDKVSQNKQEKQETKNDNEENKKNNNDNDNESQINNNNQDTPNENIINDTSDNNKELNKDLENKNDNNIKEEENEKNEIENNEQDKDKNIKNDSDSGKENLEKSSIINNNSNNAESEITKSNPEINKSEIQNELDESTKKDISALIKYYKFKQDFTHKIELSNKGEISYIDIYLIKEEWLDKIKKFYEYEKIREKLDKNNQITNQNIIPFLKESNLFEIILDKQKKQNNELNLIKSEDFKPNLNEKIIENKYIYYPTNFDFLNEDIFRDISTNNEIIKEIKCICIFNDGKILIKYIDEEKKNYLFLVGYIDKITNKFHNEMILNYKNQDCIQYHFRRFENTLYRNFINLIRSKDNHNLFADINLPGNNVFGIILSLDNNDNIKQENINTETPGKEQSYINNSKKIIVNQEKLKYIKFLLYLHFLQENLNYKINESLSVHSFNEKYYLIKNDIISIYKNIFHYDELMKALQTNKIQLLLINIGKNNNFFLSLPQAEQLAEQIFKFLNNSYYELINANSNNIKKNLEKIDFTLEKKIYNNNPELFYYNDSQLIDEKMMNLIKNLNSKFELPAANCTFGEKAVFLKFDKILNLGKLDDKYSFNAEAIIKLKDDKNLELIFNQIKEFNLNLYMENLRFTQMHCNGSQFFDYEVYIIKKDNNNLISQCSESNLTKEIVNQPRVIEESKVVFRAQKKEPKDSSNECLQNLILFYIDYKDLKKNSQNSLKDNFLKNNFGYYYLLSYDWFMKYIKIYNLTNIFKYLMQNNLTEKITNFEQLSLEEKKNAILTLIYEWDNNIMNIDDNNVNDEALKDRNLFDVKFNYFRANTDISFKYYYEFFVVKKETYESLTKFLKLNYHIINYCYFGENSIFMYLNNDNKYTLQVGHMSKNKYYFSIDLFLDYNSKSEFEESLNLLIEKGYRIYFNNNLIFKESIDYYSPIFDEEDNILGNSFIFNRTNAIIDYANLFINNNLKNLVLFYLENKILNKTLMTKDINNFRKYYLIDRTWIEQYKNINEYNNLIKALKGNKLVINEINQIIDNDKLLITEKKLCSIIKNLPKDINVNYNKKNFNFINNASIEPIIETYQFEANNFFEYFNSFVIISEKIYNKIFGNSQSDLMNLNKQKNNYVNCIFYEGIIMIELSKYVTGIEDYVIEVGYLNNDLFIPNYVLIYKERNNFLKHLNYLNQGQGIINFFKYLNFNKGCCLTCDDENGNEIGKIYNLSIKYQDMTPNIINNIQNDNIIINNNNKNNNKIINNQIINNFNINNNFVNIGQFMPLNNSFPNQIPNNFQIQNNNSIQNQIQNNFVLPIPQNIIIDFQIPPLMGLKNVGATCYMNATLQCFSQIEKLVNYFKYKPYVEEVVIKYQKENKLCLTQSFKDLIENLWPSNRNYIKQEHIHKNSNNRYFAPYEFKQKISDMDPHFQGAQANDSKDLVNFMVMTLHEELNKASKNKQNSNFSNNIFNQTNKQIVLNNFMKEFKEENKSIISDLFYAQSVNKTFCQNCKETKYNFQIFFFLVFPLEEVRKFTIEFKKKQFMINYNYMQNINPIFFQQMYSNFLMNIQNQNSVNIYNCFEYNQKLEYFSGENAMFCNKCQGQYPASYLTRLYTAPEILIIVLNRGVGIQYKIKLEFSQTLDLTNYVEGYNKRCKYNLIGVVTHMGESGASGHFIAYCKSPIDGLWYRYNDDLVSQVFNFQQEIIDYAMPYILFFQRST